MKLLSATIATNPKKRISKVIAKQVEKFLKKHKVKIIPAKTPFSSAGHILITVGGDGTILYNKNRYSLPIFAIGSKSSFICQAIGSTWKWKLLPIIKNGYTIEKRTMLSAKLNGKMLPDALNEFVIRSREHRVIRLHLQYGKKSSSFRADGLIFSTGTGSHAYAYSAGGREMPNLSRSYQVVPICPYRREFSHVMLSPSVHCKLKIEPSCRADAVSDGQFLFPIAKKAVLHVWVSKNALGFVKEAI